jgi:peptide/nickel transport system permease protein
MKYRTYIIKRILLIIPVIFGVSFFSWFLIDISGDPLVVYFKHSYIFMTDEEVEIAKEKLGFDQPWFIRYLKHVETIYIKGDWGVSPFYEAPIRPMFLASIPASIELAVIAISLSILIGVPLGIRSAIKPFEKREKVNRVVTVAGAALPVFIMAMIVQYLVVQLSLFFSVILGDVTGTPASDWMIYSPQVGRYNHIIFHYPTKILFGLLPPTKFLLIDSLLAFDIPLFIDACIHILLPAISIAFGLVIFISRMTRTAMVEVLREDYIVLARAKGLSEKSVIYGHALRNSLFPLLTVSGIYFAELLTGLILVESIFAWPGLGNFVVDAILWLDFIVVHIFCVFTAIVFSLSTLIVDLLYAYFDPRIRFG